MNPQPHASRRFETLPFAPQVVLKALQACSREKDADTDLARICVTDAALSIAILQAAGVTRQAPSGSFGLEKAIGRLGRRTIRQILVKALVQQTFGRDKNLAFVRVSQFWWHSMTCACLARRLAKAAIGVDGEEAYLAGLVHDIGKLVLAQQDPGINPALRSRPQSGVSFTVFEREGHLRHFEIGARLVQQATGNPLLADAVRYHHEPRTRIRGAFDLVKVVYIANALAQQPENVLLAGAQLAEKVFQISLPTIRQMISEVNGDVRKAARFLDIDPPAGEETLSKSASAKTHLKEFVYEVKNSSLLSAALQQLIQTPSRSEVLKSLNDSLKINLGVDRLIIFLRDADGDVLRLFDAREQGLPAGDLEIALADAGGVIAHTAASTEMGDSFHLFTRAAPSIADEQIVHLLGSEGFVSIALAGGGKCLGVLVIGCRRSQARGLAAQSRLIGDLAENAASCILQEAGLRQALQRQAIDTAALVPRRLIHEVNNPLSIIKNYIKVLSMKLPEDHSGREELQLIIEEVDRVSRIIRQTSSISRPRITRKTSIDLNRRLEAFLRILEQSLLSPHRIVLQLDLDRHLPPVFTDWDAMKQVLINLVKNAAEAMPGGGWLYLRTRHLTDRREETAAKSEDGKAGRIEIVVRDNGPGIPGALQSGLFEPYTSAKGEPHSGLGLYVVHSVVSTLGGSIRFSSRAGQGTTFVLTFPVDGGKKKHPAKTARDF